MAAPPRVLVVDDEPALLELYTAWLDDEDVEIVRASCGAEALSRCEEGDIDVAILDRNMPRVSGDEVLDELCGRSNRPRVAFVTAAPPDVQIVDLDIDAYLTKPVGREEFVDLVQAMVQRETLCETVDRYVTNLSKRAALLEAKSRAVLQADPVYAAFEKELSHLSSRIDRRSLDDPHLRRALPDGGVLDSSEPTA